MLAVLRGACVACQSFSIQSFGITPSVRLLKKIQRTTLLLGQQDTLRHS